MLILKKMRNFIFGVKGSLTSIVIRQKQDICLIIPDDSKWDIIKSIILMRSYDYKDLKLESLKGVVVDAGAHVGVVTSMLASYASKVLSIEPDQRNIRILKFNCDYNNFPNVELILKALWINTRPVLFTQFKSSEQGYISENGTIKVQSIDFKSLVANYDEIDLFKFDIEGAEFEIFPTIPVDQLRKVKNFVGECHATKESVGKITQLQDYFLKNGYDVQLWQKQMLYSPMRIFQLLHNFKYLKGECWYKFLCVLYVLAPLPKPFVGKEVIPILYAKRK
jgi:FkbM family methyltransferase